MINNFIFFFKNMKQEYINHFNTIFGDGRYEEMENQDLEQAEALFLKTIENRGYKIKEDVMIIEKYEKLKDTEDKIYFLKRILRNRMPLKVGFKIFLTYFCLIWFIMFFVFFINSIFNRENILFIVVSGMISLLLFIPIYKYFSLNKRIYTEEEKKIKKEIRKNNLEKLENFFTIIGIIGLVRWLFKK
ncbi:hypothetical protein D8B46_00360 [Candidatus Gracilibacteria bacterium]|nr:MAG: hypothetical protein D8B46_00360 [Candidatus Gracilibacteria bacterium]